MMKKDKLHSIAPLLSDLSSKGIGFDVPKNYFNTIEDAVISTLHLQKIQTTTSSTFKTPEDYFENFEDLTFSKLKATALLTNEHSNIPTDYFKTVEDRVFTRLKEEKKVISIKKLVGYIAPLAVAASLLLIFTLNTKQETVTFDSLATAEIEAFINSGLVDLDPDNVTAAFTDVELANTSLTTSLTENEVLDYLANEDIETFIYEN
jgi:Glu-tRNA(Gln) amidotransferase subunit E-like FAD-binding protein